MNALYSIHGHTTINPFGLWVFHGFWVIHGFWVLWTFVAGQTYILRRAFDTDFHQKKVCFGLMFERVVYIHPLWVKTNRWFQPISMIYAQSANSFYRLHAPISIRFPPSNKKTHSHTHRLRVCRSLLLGKCLCLVFV